MADKRTKRRRSKEALIEDGDQEDGISNPSLDMETEAAYQTFSQTEGETSAAEIIEETEQAEALKGELRSRHRRRRKELSKLVSPQDDLTKELKTVKLDSRKKIDETEQEEELAAALAAAGAAAEVEEDLTPLPVEEDGTIPMPAEEESMAEETMEKIPTSPPKSPDIPPEVSPKDKEPSITKEETEPKKEEPPPTDRKRSTMRERMKSRLAKAKEEAETEIEKQERDERKKTLSLRKETRFQEGDRQMDEAELAKLEARTEKMRKMRRDRAAQNEALSFMPTQEESFDFFTREWEPEPDTAVEAEEAKPAEQEEGEEKAEDEEETEEERAAKEEGKKEEDRLLDDDDYTPEGYGPIAIRRATMMDPEKVALANQQMLYYPSSAATPATEKVSEELEPRFKEDEGLYVGIKPAIAVRNKSKMENRLLKEAEKSEQAKRWFGEDGQLIILPDPLRDCPVRPPVMEEDTPYLETVFQKAIVREFDNRYIDGAVDGGGYYQLDVDVNSIVFSHHHLFSKEHVLAHKLSSLYEEYLSRSKRNVTEFYVEKLAALKKSSALLYNYIVSHKGDMSVADRDNYERRLRDYKSEIRITRVMRDKEEQIGRTLMKNIISTWKEMKTLREQQQYTNTPLKLQIQKQETNKDEDRKQWNLELEEELKEEQEKYEEEFMRKEAMFKDQMEKFEKQQKNKEEAAKRIADRTKQRRGSKTSKTSKNSQETVKDSPKDPEHEDDILDEENERDQEIIDEEGLEKPEPPEPFDEKAVKEQILTKAKASKRRPGEAKLFPELTSTAIVTPNSNCSRAEQQRREDVSKCKLYVKILFNGKEVSRTVSKPLTSDFTVEFRDIFNLKIVEWPESIKYEVFETLGFGSGVKLADVFAPIPESSVTSQSVALENVEFSSFEQMTFSHEGVGSGHAFKFEGHIPDLVTLMTTGQLNTSVAWAVGEDGLPLVPSVKFGEGFQAAMQLKRLDPFAAIGASGVDNMEKLLQWFKDSRLDPNDPNNKDIVYMLSGNDQSLLKPREYFRLEPMQQEFDFTTQEEIDKNLRYKMILLRNSEHPMFKNYQMIPAYDKELPRDIFKDYEKKIKEETKLPQVKGDLDQHRAQVNLYLQQIKDRVMAQYRFASHQKSLQDVVNEDMVPNISMLATSLLRFSEPRRPLKPVRKERKKVTAQALDGKEVKILINIIRASYVPVRKASANMGGTSREGEARDALDNYGELVCPFIEVMFQRSRARTRRAEGPNPSFNEELELILKVPNEDYSPSTLQSIEDVIYLNLFDEVTVDVLEDNREREGNVHQRIEKKWLGSIKIPFSTVYFNNKIDGTFRVDTPPFLLGYTRDASQVQPGISEVESSINKGQGSTFISMFVTIEPSLILPEPFKEKLASNEEEDLLQHAEVWQAKLESKFPNRPIKTTVMDTMGKNVFVTRYFRSIKPPPEVEACTEPSKAMELAARYVSLIPFVADTTLFPGQCDIWSTCNQFMKMLCGDEEEHAVLLTNFFLGMGKNAWVLLGIAVPEGSTAYVLTEDNGNYAVWNARSGEKFSVYDNYCPLQVVGCLINADNIWANIQQYEKPSQMDFNIANTGKWQPFYTKSFLSRGLASVQPMQLPFKKDKKFASLVVELQERIEQMLKNKIMEWRSRYITRWNRHCTQIMRRLLPLLEENCGKSIDQSNLKDLEESFKSYKVSGFPLNIPYSDMDSITEAVFSTGVHAQETSDVEFALAVYVHGYSNNVMSIWIYVASLIRLR